MMRQGIAPWRGIIEVGVEAADFFLIFAEPIRACWLLLEQTIESGAGIARVARRGRVLHQSIRVACRDGVARDSDHRREIFARIGLVFQRDAHRHGLVALKARRGIKMHALFTAMQRRPAFRAVSSKVCVGRKRHSTAKTARGDDILHEPRKFWTGDINRRFGALRFRAVSPERTVAATF